MATSTLRRWAAQVTSTGTAAATDIKSPDAATDYLYLTKLFVQIITHANAKTSTIQDSAASPVVIAVINDLTVASGTNKGEQFVFDFGRRGWRLTLGKKLQILDSASGCVCTVVAEGYQSTT